jgi:hypothetical protein
MQMRENAVKYSDFLKFFEVYPEVVHIYENTMNSEIYHRFIKTATPLVKDMKFPTGDLCRVFNTIVKSCSFLDKQIGSIPEDM